MMSLQGLGTSLESQTVQQQGRIGNLTLTSTCIQRTWKMKKLIILFKPQYTFSFQRSSGDFLFVQPVRKYLHFTSYRKYWGLCAWRPDLNVRHSWISNKTENCKYIWYLLKYYNIREKENQKYLSKCLLSTRD